MNNELEYKLFDLNDYCLLQIINFLDLKSKLKLHITCKRFNWLILGWFNNQRAFGDLKYSQIELCTNKEHKIDEYQYSLKSITGNSLNNAWNLNIMMLARLFQLSQRIECLHFNCLDDESSVNEKLIITILGALSKITCLSFGIGLQISSKSWNLIVGQLGNQLQHLQINRVNYLTLENIVKHCPNLISLYIRFCPSAVGCVSYLWPKLRRLRIQSMATIYLRNADFAHRNRQMNMLENEDDEDTINLAMEDLNLNNNPFDNPNINRMNFGTNQNVSSNVDIFDNLVNRAERHLNELNSTWYLNLVELRLNRITVKSLTVIFNHCINLQVLDLVLFFNRASLIFENQDFIQLSYRLLKMRLFALDVHTKWNVIQLDKGLALMFPEWPKIEVIIIKRGLITEDLFIRIRNDCKNLKVLCVEFSDYIPYNHRLNEITDRVVDNLIEFKKLTKLRLHFTGITDDAVSKLIENLSNLKYLDLFGCLKVTEKSLRAISNKLDKANICNALLSNQSNSRKTSKKSFNIQMNRINSSTKSSYRLRKQALMQLIDSDKSIEESIKSNSCRQFDVVTANCADCGKKPQTFYLTINRTKVDLKKTEFKPPNTLFVVGEDDEIWNNHNYHPSET